MLVCDPVTMRSAQKISLVGATRKYLADRPAWLEVLKVRGDVGMGVSDAKAGDAVIPGAVEDPSAAALAYMRAAREEIVPTPGMVSAGIEALKLSFDRDGQMDDADRVVQRIYIAMVREAGRVVAVP